MEVRMGFIGILLLLTAVAQFGATPVGFAIGAVGAIFIGLGLRFGFCPACTVACLLTKRPE